VKIRKKRACNYVNLYKQCGKRYRVTNCLCFGEFVQTSVVQTHVIKKIALFRWYQMCKRKCAN